METTWTTQKTTGPAYGVSPPPKTITADEVFVWCHEVKNAVHWNDLASMLALWTSFPIKKKWYSNTTPGIYGEYDDDDWIHANLTVMAMGRPVLVFTASGCMLMLAKKDSIPAEHRELIAKRMLGAKVKVDEMANGQAAVQDLIHW